MGLFDIFKKPIYEKYGELIHALKEHYQSLQITKAEASVFSMSANHCNNIDNLNITIYRGNAFNEHPAEYKNLYYDNYVFVKITYSINGEAISIRNAFPKNGNQFMMFASIIGAEIIKTNHEIELQHQKEVEKKKAEEEKIRKEQEKLEKLKAIRQEIESSCQENLSEDQKVALIAYLCNFTGNTCRNKLKYCMLFNAGISKFDLLIPVEYLNSLYEAKLHIDLISIRNRNAVYTFIRYCCTNIQKRALFTEVLKEWGFQNFEIEEFIKFPPTLPEIKVLEDIFNPTDISSRQKKALSNIIGLLTLQIPTSSVRIGVVSIIDSYRKILGIPSESADWGKQDLLKSKREEYIQSINTIWEVSYIEVFIFIGINIIKLADYNDLVIQYFKEIIEKLSFTQNTIQEIINRKFSYEWEKYKEDLKIIGIQTASIVQTWSLLDFAKEYGPRMQVCDFISNNTKEEFKACKFIKPDGISTLVSFGKKLGELTPAEITARKHQLRVSEWVINSKKGFTLYQD